MDSGGPYFGGLYFGGPYFGGHSFVSGGYVLAKEGIGKVCNAPEGMGKVFSLSISKNWMNLGFVEERLLADPWSLPGDISQHSKQIEYGFLVILIIITLFVCPLVCSSHQRASYCSN